MYFWWIIWIFLCIMGALLGYYFLFWEDYRASWGYYTAFQWLVWHMWGLRIYFMAEIVFLRIIGASYLIIQSKWSSKNTLSSTKCAPKCIIYLYNPLKILDYMCVFTELQVHFVWHYSVICTSNHLKRQYNRIKPHYYPIELHYNPLKLFCNPIILYNCPIVL